jgi:hypothetical protein
MRISRAIMRRLVTIGIVLPSLAAIGPSWQTAAAGSRAPNLTSAMQAWHDSLETWTTLSDASRRERAKGFMRRIDDEEIGIICRECAHDQRLGIDGAAFLRARFGLLPPEATELLSMVRDTSLGLPCHRTVLQNISANRDRFAPAVREQLGGALLELADRCDYDDETRKEFHLAAAYLSNGDAVLERLRVRIRSDNPAEIDLGIRMALESHDPRAVRLLEDRIDLYGSRSQPPPNLLLSAYARKAGRDGYDTIVPFLARGDAAERMAALQALCATSDPRAMRQLLDAYGDGGAGLGAAISRLFENKRETRDRELLLCSQTLEPTMIVALGGTDPADWAIALELIERGARIGPPADPTKLLLALRAFAAAPGRDPTSVQRAQGIASRIEEDLKQRLRSSPRG